MTDQDNLDYGAHTPKPAHSVIAEISRLVDVAAQLKASIDVATQDLAADQAELDRLLNKQIPEQMQLCGLREITTTRGYKVKLESQLFANIPSVSTINKERDGKKRSALIQRRNDAIKWLEENGHGDIVKRELTVQFGKGQIDLAHDVRTAIEAHVAGLPMAEVQLDESIQVHHKTLAALVSELRDLKQDVPEDLLGVYEPFCAKVSK